MCRNTSNTDFKAAPPARARVPEGVCVWTHAISQVGWAEGVGETGGCGSNLHSKSPQTQVEPLGGGGRVGWGGGVEEAGGRALQWNLF